jgi:MFS superfamily sulfate permease-like transporter
MSKFLNEKGDQIQVLCLQNYLFFGNASSIYSYTFELFEENNGDEDFSAKCKPKFLILDFVLVSGVDTSTVDVLSQIKTLCTSNECKLFIAGMSQNIKSVLSFGGFKPDTGIRSERKLRFFDRLDAALGKAEDMLLDSDFDNTHQALARSGIRRLMIKNQSGFRTALLHIDIEVSEIIFNSISDNITLVGASSEKIKCCHSVARL